MNRSIVILKTLITIWEVSGNDWPQTTVQIKIIRSFRADRKASLSDITNRLNNSENINVCKKKHVEVYSKQKASSVRMQEENT
jgi:hypothetical protein